MASEVVVTPLLGASVEDPVMMTFSEVDGFSKESSLPVNELVVASMAIWLDSDSVLKVGGIFSASSGTVSFQSMRKRVTLGHVAKMFL